MLKIISTHVEATVKQQEINDQVAVSYKFLQKLSLKQWNMI